MVQARKASPHPDSPRPPPNGAVKPRGQPTIAATATQTGMVVETDIPARLDALPHPEQMLDIGAAPTRGPDDKDRIVVRLGECVIIQVMLQTDIAIIHAPVNEDQNVGFIALFEAGPNCFGQIIRHRLLVS